MRTHPRALLALAATGFAVLLSVSACFGAPAGSDNGNGGGSGGNSPSAAAVDASPIQCQTSAAELYIYLQGNKAMFAQAGSPAELGDPVCVDIYAMAQVKAKAGATGTPEYALFSYNRQNVHWSVLAVGATGICAGKVPDAVAKVLPGCGAA